jgi:hypothetical protein
MAHEEGAVSLRRWVPYVTVAVLTHAAIFAASGHLRRSAAPAPVPGPPDHELTFDLDTSAPAPAPALTPTPALTPAITPAPTPALALASTPSPSSESASSLEPSPSSSAPAPSSEGEPWTFSPTRPFDVASPDALALAARDVAKEATPAMPTRSAGGLSEALDQRDAEMGLGRGGPVLSALEAASRSMDVPIEGWATFDIAIDTSGRVSVALTDAGKDSDAWSKVARAAGASVDPKSVRIPPGARGWHVAVRIDAKVQYPDGSRPEQLGTRFEATPGKVSKTSMVMEKTPGFTISTQGKVCRVALHVDLPLPSISGGCSLENAGAPRCASCPVTS